MGCSPWRRRRGRRSLQWTKTGDEPRLLGHGGRHRRRAGARAAAHPRRLADRPSRRHRLWHARPNAGGGLRRSVRPGGAARAGLAWRRGRRALRSRRPHRRAARELGQAALGRRRRGGALGGLCDRERGRPALRHAHRRDRLDRHRRRACRRERRRRDGRPQVDARPCRRAQDRRQPARAALGPGARHDPGRCRCAPRPSSARSSPATGA